MKRAIPKRSARRTGGLLVAGLAAACLVSCAYYNTLYNARLKYDEAQAIKDRADPERDGISPQEERLYTESFERAAKVVKFHRESKWVDDALLLMGKVSFEKGEHTTAVRKFDELLTLYPKSNLTGEALLMKGRSHIETKEYAHAVKTFSLASDRGEKKWRDDITYFLGRVQYESEDADGAKASFLTVLEEHGGSEWFADAGLRLGDIAMEEGDTEGAIAFYERVRSRAKTGEQKFFGGMRKGGALLELGRYEEARKTFDNVAKSTSDPEQRGSALLQRGAAIHGLGDREGAIAVYRDILEKMARTQSASDAQLAIARIYDDEGDYDRALEEYGLVREQGTGFPAWQTASERQRRIQSVLDLRRKIAAAQGGDATEPEADAAEDGPEVAEDGAPTEAAVPAVEPSTDTNRDRFLLAEQLLESIGDTGSALDEYETLSQDAHGTEWGAKALYARAWIFEHRLDRADTAEALLGQLAGMYAGTEVDAAARTRLGRPVWRIETIDAPPVHFIRPSEEDVQGEDVVLERVQPKAVELPEGVTEARVWVRVAMDESGRVESAKVVKSGGDEVDAAALEAARATVFRPKAEGGPSYTVLEYQFPPEQETPAPTTPIPETPTPVAPIPVTPPEQIRPEDVATPDSLAPVDSIVPDVPRARPPGFEERTLIPPPRIDTGVVTQSTDAAPGVGLLVFECADVAAAYRPGSFVHLRTGDPTSVLRRPFSIARVRGDEIVLLYRIVGGGTRWMRSLRRGDSLDVMGPLGRPFDLRRAAPRTLLVGGGLGIAPLLGLAEALQAADAPEPMDALLGMRGAAEKFGPQLTDGMRGLEWSFATDDGSLGLHGTVVELLDRRLAELEDSISEIAVYAAGPEPMLEATASVCVPRDIDLQVSMEAHMGCGVGACRACGIVTYRDLSRLTGRVCCEGPVFDAREILWEEVGV